MSNYSHKFYDNLLMDQDNTVYVANKVYGRLNEYIDVNSVVDVGCGVGSWLRVMYDAGITDVLGIDGNWVEESQLIIDKEKVRRQDLNERINIERRFDLAQTFEVAEHLKPERADSLVEDLTKLSDVVLFSAAIPYQGGEGHINEQWPGYWIEKFNDRRYKVFDVIRTELWNDNNVTLQHYKQNILLFINTDAKEKIQAGMKMKETATPIYDMAIPYMYCLNAAEIHSKKYQYATKIARFVSIFGRKKV